MGMGQAYWGTHGALSAGASPILLTLGDSWFWYPVDNLAVEIQAGFPNNDVVVIGKNGAEATDWQVRLRKDIKGAHGAETFIVYRLA